MRSVTIHRSSGQANREARCEDSTTGAADQKGERLGHSTRKASRPLDSKSVSATQFEERLATRLERRARPRLEKARAKLSRMPVVSTPPTPIVELPEAHKGESKNRLRPIASARQVTRTGFDTPLARLGLTQCHPALSAPRAPTRGSVGACCGLPCPPATIAPSRR